MTNAQHANDHRAIAPSGLPSFILPCPHCGHRMEITAVAPARFDNGAESNDLEDVTHGCVQCGTTLIRTVRPLSGDVHEIAPRV
jgi:phage terminase large subunit GpA-like protein